EEQEVKNIVEQAPKHRTRITKCLKNFKVIQKENIIHLNKTPQISSVNAITPILPTKEPKYSLRMGDEHLSTILESKSDEIIKSSVENLVPILSDYEDHSEILFDSNDDGTSSDDEAFEDIEYVEATLPDSKLVSLEEVNDVNQKEKEIDSEDILQVQDIEPGQRRLTSVVMDNIFDNSTNDPLLEIVDLFLASDNSISPSIENIDYDLEGDIHFLKEILNNDSIPLPENKSSNFDHHDDPSFSHPPPEPPNVEVFFDFEPDTGALTTKVVIGISGHYVLPTLSTPYLVFDPLLSFSSENEDKVFKPCIISNLI
nr:hypothetical protein [Tanacetum cinerariifolium]